MMDYFTLNEEFDMRFTPVPEVLEEMDVHVLGLGLSLKTMTHCPPRERDHFVLMMTLDGSAWMQEGKKRKRIFRNDWTLLMPNQIHTYESINEWSFMHVKFEGKFVDYIVKRFSFTQRDYLCFRQSENDSKKILLKLVENRKDLGLASEIHRNALLLELLCNLHSNYASKGRNENPIIEAEKYIRENLTKPIPIDILAQKTNMSLSNFMKIFKERLGYTPVNLINKLRIERAQELITLHSSAKLYEIAEMSGFNDPYYFSRVFKKWTQMSPADFRKYYKENHNFPPNAC